jgi:hypothetical protein
LNFCRKSDVENLSFDAISIVVDHFETLKRQLTSSEFNVVDRSFVSVDFNLGKVDKSVSSAESDILITGVEFGGAKMGGVYDSRRTNAKKKSEGSAGFSKIHLDQS